MVDRDRDWAAAAISVEAMTIADVPPAGGLNFSAMLSSDPPRAWIETFKMLAKKDNGAWALDVASGPLALIHVSGVAESTDAFTEAYERLKRLAEETNAAYVVRRRERRSLLEKIERLAR